MALQADITIRIDASALIQTLLDALTAPDGPVATLAGVAVPIDPARLADAVTVSEGASGGTDLAALAARIAAQAAPLLEALPGPAEVVRPITAAVELAEQLTAGDLVARLEALVAKLQGELEDPTGGGIAALLRAVETLRADPSAQTLLTVVLHLVGAGGRSQPPAIGALVDLLPAIAGGAELLARLTALATVLGEAERVTGLAAGRLDAARVRDAFTGLAACFDAGGAPLAAWLDALDPARPAELRAGVAAARLCADRLADVAEGLSAAIAFGEASLVWLDVDTVLAEIRAAAAAVRAIDLAPLERLVARLVGGLAPAVGRPIEAGPADALDHLVGLVEAEIARLAGVIATFDPTVFTAPLDEGLQTVTGLFDRIGGAIDTANTTLRGALAEVAAVVRALPLEQVTAALDAVLDPVTAAMQTVSGFIADIEAALDLAASTAGAAIDGVEGLLDGFKGQIDALFADARAFVEQIDLDAVVGAVRGGIEEVAELIAKARLAPYFDAATGAVDTAAGVAEAVPWSLLPESMKADVDAAVKPIKAIDLAAFADRIEQILGLGPDGFALRGDLEAAVADIAARYDALVAAIAAHDPRQYLAMLDGEFEALAERIRDFAPDLSLEPIREAIDTVKAAVADIDLDAVLEPLRGVFDQVLEAIDTYAPDRLVQPLEDRIAAVRDGITAALRFDTWRAALTDLGDRARAALAAIDPAQLQPLLEEAFTAIRAELDRLPDVPFGRFLGGLLSTLFASVAGRLSPARFDTVLGWFSPGGSGAAWLNARAEHIARAITGLRDAVRDVDIVALSAEATTRADALRAAVQRLIDRLPPGDDERIRLEATLPRLDARGAFGALAAHRDRVAAIFDAAAQAVETLRRTGLSEVDVAITRMRAALDPARALGRFLDAVLARLGLPGLDGGIAGLLRGLLDVIPPARLAGVLAPLFDAARGRLDALLAAVIDPLTATLDALDDLIAAVSLQPLIDAAAEIRQAVLDELAPLDPDALLGDAVAAFAALQATVADFDPLGDLHAVLDVVQTGAARLLEKLSAEALLESPLAIYDHILAELRTLSLDGLLAPILDQLDVIAREVDEGLDKTVTAFERLQDALPAGGGGSQGSVSVEVV